jgi:sodium/bile acid cotransporter 7
MRLPLLAQVQRNWFLVSIVVVIIMARVDPSIGCSGGLLRPEITVKILAVATIFFVSGLTIKGEEMWSAVTQYRVHLFIQTFSFVLVPVVVQMLAPFVRGIFQDDESLING